MFSRRPFRPDDYDFLRALHRATMRPYVEPIWGWDEDVQKHYFDAHFDPATIEIISVEGQDIGAVTIERQEDCLFLSNIHLLPEFQGRGIGTAIIKEMLERAAVVHRPAALRVLKNNPARRLYERLGFQIAGETETHYLMRAEPS
jgi:GNAT superfamily N-acetyltransferase